MERRDDRGMRFEFESKRSGESPKAKLRREGLMKNYECKMLNGEEECSVFRVQCSARKDKENLNRNEVEIAPRQT